MTKKQAEKLVKRVKAIREEMKEISLSVKTCWGGDISYWHIYRENDFYDICNALGLTVSEEKFSEEYPVKLTARYGGLEIFLLKGDKQ